MAFGRALPKAVFTSMHRHRATVHIPSLLLLCTGINYPVGGVGMMADALVDGEGLLLLDLSLSLHLWLKHCEQHCEHVCQARHGTYCICGQGCPLACGCVCAEIGCVLTDVQACRCGLHSIAAYLTAITPVCAVALT